MSIELDIIFLNFYTTESGYAKTNFVCFFF